MAAMIPPPPSHALLQVYPNKHDSDASAKPANWLHRAKETMRMVTEATFSKANGKGCVRRQSRLHPPPTTSSTTLFCLKEEEEN